MKVGHPICGLAFIFVAVTMVACGQSSNHSALPTTAIPRFPKEGINSDRLVQLKDGMTSDSNDPLVLIHATNALVPLGTDKALKFIRDYANSITSDRGDRWLYLLVRVAFVGKKPDYVFPELHLGYVQPTSAILAKWPTYPVSIIDDVPIMVNHGADTPGISAPFTAYLDENCKDWKLRDKPILLPDDPFPLFRKILRSGMVDPKDDRNRVQVASEILRLVRTAYQARDTTASDTWRVDESKFEKAHQGFLALGCRWDSKLGLYVRKDGSYDPDNIKDYPLHRFVFPDMGSIWVTMTFRRATDREIEFSVETSERAGRSIPTGVMLARNPTTKSILDWTAINSPSTGSEEETTWEKMLMEFPHASTEGTTSKALSLSLPSGDPVQFEIRFNGNVHQSPIFNP